jgi:Uncharacterized protein conserved in bacteria (DUF2213)
MDVNPDNWKGLAVGAVQHPRRGEGDQHDMLVADLLITDRRAIELIKSGKKELSCGYDVDYEELSPGIGRHFNIVINHVAIVDEGRCGPRCAIVDSKGGGGFVTEASLKLNAYRKSDGTQEKEPAMGLTVDNLHGMGSTEGGLHHLHPGIDDSDHVHVHIPGGHTVEGDSVSHHMGSSGHHGGHFERFKHHSVRTHHKDRRRRHHDDAEEPEEGFHERLSHLEDAMHHVHRMVTDLHRGRHHGGHDEDPEEEYEYSEEPHRAPHFGDRGHRHHRDDMAECDDETYNMGGHIEGPLEFEAPPGTGDRHRHHRDRGHRGYRSRSGHHDRRPGRGRDSWTQDGIDNIYQQVVAMAEVLVPGIKIPTYDSVCNDPGRALCAFRKKVLDIASSQEGTAYIISNIVGSDQFSAASLSCRDAAVVYKAAATAKAAVNNGSVRRTTDVHAQTGTGGGLGIRSRIKTPSELNAKNREFYAAVAHKASGSAS